MGDIFALYLRSIFRLWHPEPHEQGKNNYLPIATSYAVLLSTYVVTRDVPSHDLNCGIDVLN